MNTRLYVGNLSFRTTSDRLREVFASTGCDVTDAHVVTDRYSGQSRGFGFVTLSDAQQMPQAISQMNGFMLDGRPLRVNEAEDRPEGGAPKPRFERSGGGGNGGGGGGRSGGFGGGGGGGGGRSGGGHGSRAPRGRY